MSSTYRCHRCGFRGSLQDVEEHECPKKGGSRKITASVPVAGMQSIRLNPQNPFAGTPFPQTAAPPTGPVGGEPVITFFCKYNCGHFSTSWEDVRRHEENIHETQTRSVSTVRVTGTPVSTNSTPSKTNGVRLETTPSPGAPGQVNGTKPESNGSVQSGAPRKSAFQPVKTQSPAPPPPSTPPRQEGVGFVPFSSWNPFASNSPETSASTAQKAPPSAPPPAKTPTSARQVEPPVLPTPKSEQAVRSAPMYSAPPVPVPRAPREPESDSEQGDEEEEDTALPVLLAVVGPAAAAFVAVLVCMPVLEGHPEWPVLSVPGLDLDLFDFGSNATASEGSGGGLMSIPMWLLRGVISIPLTLFSWLASGGGSIWDFTRHSVLENILWLLWWIVTLIASIIQMFIHRINAIILTSVPIYVIAKLNGKYTSSKVLAVVATWFDLRLPIFVAAIVGYWGWSLAWPTILAPCVVWQMHFSRDRARRRGESVAYSVPLLGPKAIRRVVNSITHGQTPREATNDLQPEAACATCGNPHPPDGAHAPPSAVDSQPGKQAPPKERGAVMAAADRTAAFFRRTWEKLTTEGDAGAAWDRVVPRWGGRMFNGGLRGGFTRRREHEVGLLSGENAKVRAVVESDGEDALKEFLVRNFDYVHVVLAVVVSYLLARAGCAVAAVPISSLVVYAECTIRKEKFRRLDQRADRLVNMLSAPTMRRCDDCAQDLESFMRGADHRRCDVSAAWLNNFMSDILWPAYSEWIAAWLDSLVESFVAEFGVTIDDDSRTVGDQPIKLANVWGRMGRATKFRQVIIQENERWWPTGWKGSSGVADPAHFCIWDQEGVEEGQDPKVKDLKKSDQQTQKLEKDLKGFKSTEDILNMEPTLEGWEWAPEGWDHGAWQYALDFPTSKKMLFMRSTWKEEMEKTSCVRRRQWSRWMICRDDQEEDHHVYELFLEIDWKSSCNLRIQVYGIEVDLEDLAANLKTVFTFEFQKTDYDKDPNVFPGLYGLTMGVTECPIITFSANADNHQVLGNLVAGILSMVKPSLVSNIVYGVFTPPMRFMGQERTWERAYEEGLTTLANMHGYISFGIQNAEGARGGTDEHVGKQWYLSIQEVRETDDGDVLLSQYCTAPVKINQSIQAYWGEVAAFALRDKSQKWRVELFIKQDGQKDQRYGSERYLRYTDMLERYRSKHDNTPRLLCGEWTDPLETLQEPMPKFMLLDAGEQETSDKTRLASVLAAAASHAPGLKKSDEGNLIKVRMQCNVQPCDPRPLTHLTPGDKLFKSVGSLAPGFITVMPVRCQQIALVKKARLDISLCLDEDRHNVICSMRTSEVAANQSPIDPNVRGGSFNPEWHDEVMVFPYITEQLERLRLLVEIVDCSSDVPGEQPLLGTVWAPLASLVASTMSKNQDVEFKTRIETRQAQLEEREKKAKEAEQGGGAPPAEGEEAELEEEVVGGALGFCSPEFEDEGPPWPGKNFVIPDSPWYPWAQLMLVIGYRPDTQKELAFMLKVKGFNAPPKFQSTKWCCKVYVGPDARSHEQRPHEQTDKCFASWQSGPPALMGKNAVWLGSNMRLFPVVESPKECWVVITLEENGKVHAKTTGTLFDIWQHVRSGRQSIMLEDEVTDKHYQRHKFELRVDFGLSGAWDAAFLQHDVSAKHVKSGVVRRCPGASKWDGLWEKKRLVLTDEELYYEEPHLQSGRSAGLKLSEVEAVFAETSLPESVRTTMRGFRVRLRATGREELFAYNPVAQKMEEHEKREFGSVTSLSFHSTAGELGSNPRGDSNPFTDPCDWVASIQRNLVQSLDHRRSRSRTKPAPSRSPASATR